VGVGLTFGHEGHLYISDEVNGNVQRFNGHTGVFLGIFAFGIDTPRFLIFGPDGNLYVSSLFTASIVRFNGNTGAPLGTFVTAPGLFPEGLVFGPNGNLYVSDESNGIVLRYNGTTGALIGTFASGPHLSFPAGLTFSRPRGRSPITHLPRITPEH
jgi:DNA-binding beta-propeller fold protein YncE